MVKKREVSLVFTRHALKATAYIISRPRAATKCRFLSSKWGYYASNLDRYFSFHIIAFIASEARKAVGLSRSLAIPQLRVSVYDVTIRNTYRDPESCHRPTCGTTISLNVRDNNITQRADDFLSGGFL